MSDLMKLCGLWRNERDGKVTLSGPLGPNARVIVTRNRYKRGDKDPDFVMFLAPADRKGKNNRRSESEPPTSDEIPF